MALLFAFWHATAFCGEQRIKMIFDSAIVFHIIPRRATTVFFIRRPPPPTADRVHRKINISVIVQEMPTDTET